MIGRDGKSRSFVNPVMMGMLTEERGVSDLLERLEVARAADDLEGAFDALYEVKASTTAARGVGVSGVPAVSISGRTESQLLFGPMVPDYPAMASAIDAALATPGPTDHGPPTTPTTPTGTRDPCAFATDGFAPGLQPCGNGTPSPAVSAAASALPSAAASTAGD